MAKVKKSEKKSEGDLTRQQKANRARRKEFSAEELEQIASQFEVLVAKIKATARAMQDAEITEVRVDGATKAGAAEELLTDFTANLIGAAEKATIKARKG